MKLPGREELIAAAQIVHAALSPTAQIRWPLLGARTGAEVWVKHENHGPVGAFKLRGGIVYIDGLARAAHPAAGLIAATRGNHGQSIAYAAARAGMRATIVVPLATAARKMPRCAHSARSRSSTAATSRRRSNSPSAWPRSAACTWCRRSIRRWCAASPATRSSFWARSPISTRFTCRSASGQESAERSPRARRWGCAPRVVGVVAENAPAYALSFAAGRVVTTESADTMADGVACRVPLEDAVEIINRWAERIVTVSEAEIATAMRFYFSDTHNLAEGAGAAPLAALLKERRAMERRRVGLVLSGGNVDRDVYARVLAAE